MKVILSKDIGFCLGVKRALRLANEVLKQREGPVYTLGPLVHNPHVIEELSSKGIEIVEDLKKISSGVVILRSHGASPHLLKEAKRKGLKVVDATCPRVKRVQRLAIKLKNEGYRIVIIGDPQHPEVRGIVERIGDAWIVENRESIPKVPFSKKIGIISQTTQDFSKFKELSSLLLPRSPETRIFNTICSASLKRQRSAVELAKKVDSVVVVGGYNSANTKRIVNICKDVVKAYHIEREEELMEEWFNGTERVGITSGTSTPYDVILEVVKRIESYGGRE